MDPFKIFPGTNTEPLALEINAFLTLALLHTQGSKDNAQRRESYFDQFNKDIHRLNYLLTHPINAKKLYQKAYKLQEEYNQALSQEQDRWLESAEDFLVGKQIIKQLAQRKRQYKEALELSNLFDRKKEVISEYLTMEGWEDIFEEAQEKNCLAQMKQLRLDWIGQGEFAYCDSQDLYCLLKELKDFYWFLKLMHDIKTDNVIILNVLKDNWKALKILKKQMNAAIAWRIHAASLRGNLWFDDQVWALEYRIHALLGTELGADDKILSEKLEPIILKHFIKNLQKAQHKIDRDKWFESRWVLNPDEHYPIQVVVTDDLELVPFDLIDYIPTQRKSIHSLSSILPDYFLRYFYFRGASPSNRVEKYLKKKMMQSPYETIVLLNESFYQINVLAQEMSTQETVVLRDIIQTPGFKSALWFPEIIAKERQRISQFQYKSWFTKSVDWFHRKLLGNQTQAFCAGWIDILDKVEQSVLMNTKAIVKVIVHDLERILVEALKGDIFYYPKNLLADLSFLVNYYGSVNTKARFEAITEPAYLFTKFQFFDPIEPGQAYCLHHPINQDTVLIFLRYATLYWTVEEGQAAQAVASILVGDFPKNKKEDAHLQKMLCAWFKGDTIEINEQVMDFLHSLGCDFVVKTGMRSNVLAERFLKNYAPEAFKVWQKERESDLSEKYFLLVGLFSKVAGAELDTEAQQYQKIEAAFIDDLRRDQARNNYVAALGEAFKAYLQSYDGSNGHYAELVIHLGMPFSMENDLYKSALHYFKVRLHYLAQPFVQAELTTEECACYVQIGAHKKIREIIKYVLLKQEHIEKINLNIYSILRVLDNAELIGIFFFKRMSMLMSAGLLTCIYKEIHYFDANKNNPVFIAKINKFFAHFLKNQYEIQGKKIIFKIHWIIESYGILQIKEKSRYLLIKQFLESLDKSNFNAFLKELKVYTPEENLESLFHLETFKRQLNILYYKYNVKMLKQGYWDGYAQYIMENIHYPQTQTCIFGGRIAWLNALLFNYPPYLKNIRTNLERFPMIDFHMHYIQIPNNDIDLPTFFGSAFVQMKKIITQYLDEFEVYPSDRKLKLISRYLEDAAFRQDEAWSSLHFKLSVYYKLHYAMHYLIQHDWEPAKQALYALRNQIIGYRLLLPNTKDKVILEQKLQYYETMLKILYKTICFYCDSAMLEDNGILEIFVGLNDDTDSLSDGSVVQDADDNEDNHKDEEDKGAHHRRETSFSRVRISPILALKKIS